MTMRLKTMRLKTILCTTVVSVGLPLVAHAQTPILRYDFNETGTQAAASGSAAVAGAPVLNITGSGAARGGAGSGVSGAAGDRAFDNTLSSGIFGAGRAEHAGDFDPIDGLSSFTLTGWYRLPTGAEKIGRQASLIENINYQASSSTQGGFGLTGSAVADSGGLRLRVNEVAGVESDPGTYADVGVWVNFAVTYDGATVNFYKGLVDQPITLVDTASYARGAVAAENERLILGVSAGGSSLTFNPLQGLIDEVAIFGQVLNPTQLEAIRASVVPEPAALSMVGVLACLVRRRRH
jgi:Concanavalin A-like lectin/glucanases superfamily